MAARRACQPLECQRGAVKELQCARNALQKMGSLVFRRFVIGPQHITDFRHSGKPVVHLRGITLGFPRVAPSPVDTDAAPPSGVLTGDVVLVVGPCGGRRAHRAFLSWPAWRGTEVPSYREEKSTHRL